MSRRMETTCVVAVSLFLLSVASCASRTERLLGTWCFPTETPKANPDVLVLRPNNEFEMIDDYGAGSADQPPVTGVWSFDDEVLVLITRCAACGKAFEDNPMRIQVTELTGDTMGGTLLDENQKIIFRRFRPGGTNPKK